MRAATFAVLTAALITPAALGQAAGGIVRPVAAEEPLPATPSTIRQATAEIDMGAIRALDPAAGGALTLNLFPDATFVCDFHTFEHHANGADTWVGRIQGDERGWLVVGTAEGQAVMNLWTGDGRAFEVRPADEDGPYLVRQIDRHALGSCGGQIVPGLAGARHDHGHALPADDAGWGGQRGGTRGCDDDGSTIDVMIVWTPGARAEAGGQGAMVALTASCIAQTNVIYFNSQITTRLRLAHSAEVVYLEDPIDMAQDLYRLQDPDDGFIDQVHQLRSEHRADAVAMLVHSLDSDTAGIAYVMQTLSTDFAGSAFSVTDQANAVTGLTFAHEVGHNMGSAHDRQNSDVHGLYNYSYGWRFNGLFSGDQFRTVMAYSPGERIPHFSNMSVLYDGTPTGTPLGSPTPAHNALSINNAASTVANFRSSGDIRVTDQPDALTRNVFQSATFQVAASGGGTLGYQWQRNGVNLSNGGRFAGATTNSLTVGALTMADAGSYRCLVSNSCDSTASQAALLTVRCPADFDQGGTLTLADFIAFRNAYTGGNMAADLDNSGTLTLFDFVVFRNWYTAGCP